MRTEQEIREMLLDTVLCKRDVSWAEIGFTNALFWVLGEFNTPDDLTEYKRQKEIVLKKVGNNDR